MAAEQPIKDIVANHTALLTLKALQAQGMTQPVDLTILPGQIWMLHGVSGSGKSQWLKAIADLIEHSGQAWLNGQAQSEVCPENWRRQVMYFSAETAWWKERVGDHFEHVPTRQQLLSLGLDESFLTQNPDNLSSGEKQRLALLRGLSYQPKVLLLDEVTANLDEASTLQVEAYLQDYVQTAMPLSAETPDLWTLPAILWISHDSRQRARLTTEDLALVFSK